MVCGPTGLKKSKLGCAVISALLASLPFDPAYAQVLEEVLVTATKRTENAQDVPVAVQVLDQQALDDLNIGNFDDYIRFLPNVTSGGRGPGQSTVFIRGMAIEPITVLVSGAQGTTPNVALYLDEQPVTAPGRNLDVYATDLQRIEVLPGPQGTLFGASSQAGTVRLITNKPTLNELQVGVQGSVATIKEGDTSHSIEGYLNLPLVNNKLALRAALYNVQRGGYIDNVSGSFTTDPSINPDSSVALAPDATYQAAGNEALVKDDFNGSSYKGIRGGATYIINNEWDLLLQHSRQELDADGVFDFDPEVGDLQVRRYFRDALEDEFEQTAWTLQGRLAALEVLYTGAYLDREVEQSIDYTGYNNEGGFIPYYTCTYDNPDYVVNYGISPELITDVRECRNPVKGFTGEQEQTRSTHEIRISTAQDRRLRLVAGLFYDDFKIETLDDWHYLAAPELGFARNAPVSTARNINPDTRPEGVTFFNDITRTEEQIAVFGETSLDLIADKLTATLGLRYYEMESDFYGSSNFADGIFQGSVNTDRGRDYDRSGGHSEEPLKADDVILKFNLSYAPEDDLLFYATYSEGFRPGGFNRGGGFPSINPDFPAIPTTYNTDDVVNYEIGWKTRFQDGTIQFNGSLYFIEWTDMQVSRFDPVNVSILTFIENAADSEIIGLEGEFIWAATSELTLFAAFSYNDTQVTEVKGEAIEIVPEGSQLPLTPKFQGNLRARYNWQLGDVGLHWQVAVYYADKSYSSIVAQEREEQDSYTIADAAFGVSRNHWSAELYVENLNDERAQLFINNQDDITRITSNRPRTVGLRATYHY